ncbi:hypothetical protein LSAT2_024676 [Lamellibrachia satsuma]|nr:hypothetical protein LSAT2_024676 [Lamellibrachia satsuma]
MGQFTQWLFDQVCLANYQWIFLPICHQNHWFILVTHTQEKTVAVLDSLDNELRRKKFVALWQKYTQIRNSMLGLPMETWTEIRIACSRQEDGHSCGVFTLMVSIV